MQSNDIHANNEPPTQHDWLNEILIWNAVTILHRGINEGRCARWSPVEHRIVAAAQHLADDPASDLHLIHTFSFSDACFELELALYDFFNESEWQAIAVSAGIDLMSDEFEYALLTRDQKIG